METELKGNCSVSSVIDKCLDWHNSNEDTVSTRFSSKCFTAMLFRVYKLSILFFLKSCGN